MENFQDRCQSSQVLTPVSDNAMLTEILKTNPGATSQTLQGSVIMLNIKDYDNTIRKRLNEYGLFGRDKKALLFKKSMAVLFRFRTNHKTS